MVDTQLPLLGVIICCTSIEPERRVSQSTLSAAASPAIRERLSAFLAD